MDDLEGAPTLVTAAVIRERQTVLLARRAHGEKLAGLWEFPGGKLESGESLASCLQRELREELGVDSRIGEVLCESLYEYEGGAIRLIAMEATLATSNLRPCVHDMVEWVPLNELTQYDLAPADIPIAKWLMEH